MDKKIFIQGYYDNHFNPGKIILDMDYKYSRNFFLTLTPGKAVFDFMYLDKDKIVTALTAIQKPFDAGDIELALLRFEGQARHDAYFTTYMNIFLGCLTDRTEEDLSELAAFAGNGFVLPSVDSPDFEDELIRSIVENIEQKQSEIKSLTEDFLEELHNHYSKAVNERFMKESMTNRLADFTMTSYYNLDMRGLAYRLNSIDDMIRFELMSMLIFYVDFKKCKCCGKYFVPSGRSDSQYCDRIFGDTKSRCSQIGALKTFEKSHKNDPIHKAYIKAYRRMDSRQRANLITKAEFKDFGKTARAERQRCYNGEITLEQFQTWLDDFR